MKKIVHSYQTALDTEDGGILLILDLEGEIKVARLHQLDAEKLARWLNRAVEVLKDVTMPEIRA